MAWYFGVATSSVARRAVMASSARLRLRTTCFHTARPAALPPGPSVRLLSTDQKPPSLSQMVLEQQKQEAEKNKNSEEKKGEEGGSGEEKKGPKPMGKWQKRAYVFFGVTMFGSLVGNAIMFCKFALSIQLY